MNGQIHLNLLTPESLDSLKPLEIVDTNSSLRAAFVERYGIEYLPESWKENCGFYILFSHLRDNNSFDAYVGKASNGFYRRLKEHHETKDYWRVAILLRRDSTVGFTSTQSAYLEGRMRDILDISNAVTVRNIAPTGDRTLPEWEKPGMENVILFALRAMFLRGYRNASMASVAEDITAIASPYPSASEGLPGVLPSHPSMPSRTPLSAINPNGGLPTKPAGASMLPEIDPEEMFIKFKTWRSAKAKQEAVPPYIIFHDKTLKDIISARPLREDDLLLIPGVGNTKVERYGHDILELLQVK